MALLINQTYANETTPLWGNNGGVSGVSTVIGSNYIRAFTIDAKGTTQFNLPAEFTTEFGHAYQLSICVNFRVGMLTTKGTIGVVLNYNGASVSVQARETTPVDPADGNVQYATCVTLVFARTDPTATASWIIENGIDEPLDIEMMVTNLAAIDLGTQFSVVQLALPE